MTDTWILISFDADTSCNDCCRPLKGIASFIGFKNEKDIVTFIVNEPTCKSVYNSILSGLAWDETSDMELDNHEEMLKEMKKRVTVMSKGEIIDKFLNYLEQSWKNGSINSFILVPKKEKLFKMFRTLGHQMYQDFCDEFVNDE